MKPIAATSHHRAAGAWRRPQSVTESAHVGTAAAGRPPVADAVQTGELSFFLFLVLTYVIVGRPNDYIQALVPLRLALVTTAITAVATLMERKVGGRSPFQIRETKLYLTLYGAMLFGVPFAMHRGVTFDLVLITYASNIIYFLLFVVHVTTQQRLRQVLWVLVVGALLFTGFGFLFGTVRQDRFFIGSGMYDPNDAAYVELALLPFALCLLLGSSSSVVRRAVALASALMGMLVALYTGSRGGLLGYLTFVLLFLNLRIGILKPIHKILLLAVVAGALVMNADKINTDRFWTLTNIQSDYNYAEEWGRTDVWKNGFVMFLQDPLTGVGANNFSMAIARRRESFGLLPKWQAPHNSFVQILTEIGIVGFVAWVMLLYASAKTFWQVRKGRGGAESGELAVWAGVLFAGFIAQLVSASFLTMGYSIFFTVFFAIAVALRQISGITVEDAQARPPEGSLRPPLTLAPPVRAPFKGRITRA